MTPHQIEQAGPFYQNPVYSGSFPDPFVLKHNGEYFAYCTGHATDGRVFGVLKSGDLLRWEAVGGAMSELAAPEPFYWAPEVTYWNGTFYLYYSCGNETFMQLRVATSDRPDGGFEDAGVRLTKEDFAIDAHVFFDDDGQRYLFYATDFLDHSHIGTGVVVDRMLDWFTLEGRPTPVVRAKYDWQVYDPARKEKGGVRWHTVEGPFVLKRKGRYFMMFSGGNWQQPTYGVSFAVAGDIQGPGEWRQFSDGDKVLPILRTAEGSQVGPGHNSVIRGPNNRELYCVYHYWHEGNRVLAVNRMGFAGPRLFVESTPYLPKTVPSPASARFRLDERNWSPAGAVGFGSNSVSSDGSADASVRSRCLPASYLCEFSFVAGDIANGGEFGFRFDDDPAVLGGLSFSSKNGEVLYEWIEEDGLPRNGSMIAGREFRLDALHRITIEADHAHVAVRLDGSYLTFSRTLPRAPTGLSIFASNAKVTFSGLELCEGFEDCFESETDDTGIPRGWRLTDGKAELAVRNSELIFTDSSGSESVICKGEPSENFDFAANIRLKGPAEPGASYGFVLLDEGDAVLQRFEFREAGGRFRLFRDGEPSSSVELPSDFNTRLFYQFRFLKRAERLYFDIETIPLGSTAVTAGRARIGLISRNASVAVDAVRQIIINT